MKFQAVVTDSDYDESWSEGMTVFHNPRSLVPLDPDLLKVGLGVAHCLLRRNLHVESTLPEVLPLRIHHTHETSRSGKHDDVT